MSDLIQTRLEYGVRTIRMNRPEKKNALTGEMYDVMTAALRDAEVNAAVRVVMFAGTDGVFSAGNDLQDFLSRPANEGGRSAYAFIRALTDSTVPLVAAVDGIAVGIGTTMLLHCDFVYATSGARFSLPFINLGVCPEAGSSMLLPRLVGYQRAAELLMLGGVFDAATASRLGLITALCEPPELQNQAEATAKTLALKPREAIRATKRLMKRGEEALGTRVDVEIEQFSALLARPAAREIMAAFIEKRAPDRNQYE